MLSLKDALAVSVLFVVFIAIICVSIFDLGTQEQLKEDARIIESLQKENDIYKQQLELSNTISETTEMDYIPEALKGVLSTMNNVKIDMVLDKENGTKGQVIITFGEQEK